MELKLTEEQCHYIVKKLKEVINDEVFENCVKAVNILFSDNDKYYIQNRLILEYDAELRDIRRQRKACLFHFFKVKVETTEEKQRIKFLKELKEEIEFNILNENDNNNDFGFNVEGVQIVKPDKLMIYIDKNVDKLTTRVNFTKLVDKFGCSSIEFIEFCEKK